LSITVPTNQDCSYAFIDKHTKAYFSARILTVVNLKVTVDPLHHHITFSVNGGTKSNLALCYLPTGISNKLRISTKLENLTGRLKGMTALYIFSASFILFRCTVCAAPLLQSTQPQASNGLDQDTTRPTCTTQPLSRKRLVTASR